MKDLYEHANPYGKINIKKLEEFEKKINYDLPNDYRNYLIEYNGAEPINNFCDISEEEGEASIHCMLGIHDGPDYAKLEPVFGDNNSTKKTGVFAFAYDEGGNYFCICLLPKRYGEIYFYDSESSYAHRIETLIKISENFTTFIESLFSVQEYEKRLAETQPEVYERIQYLRNNPPV